MKLLIIDCIALRPNLLKFLKEFIEFGKAAVWLVLASREWLVQGTLHPPPDPPVQEVAFRLPEQWA